MAALERNPASRFNKEWDGKTVTDGTMHKYKNTNMIEQRLAQNNDRRENLHQALRLLCFSVPGAAWFVLPE
ncbi:hypothetical protein PpBr36_02264 [Pyricularia pennisetigena]|uniref:hypothetical protein n=1 Tax=Pyricularia pennisetigena TaxID=1578925 RepID=UPI00114EF8C9|nr:hypothetical protein PpBr36_02264 [Pyricularia pennisetigena]TLS29964.1 hypothetical protein PpBr36_02264 [Pyricularia pennisetigena]